MQVSEATKATELNRGGGPLSPVPTRRERKPIVTWRASVRSHSGCPVTIPCTLSLGRPVPVRQEFDVERNTAAGRSIASTGNGFMMESRHGIPIICLALALAAGCDTRPEPGGTEESPGPASYLTDIRQLTFGGQNAEAYWSPDGSKLVFQATRDGASCDQIYVMNADGSNQRMVSTGRGVTTCGYFLPDGETILYASTHLAGDDCPPRPDRSKGYVWPIHAGYDLFLTDTSGAEP